MFEVLAVNRKNLSQEFARGFDGMTDKPVSRLDLEAAREKLIEQIIDGMPDPHRRFLVSFEAGAPEWNLIGLSNAANLPAVKWRQHNLDGLDGKRRGALVEGLQRVLDVSRPR